MPRRCLVCTHQNRHDIDTALVSGESYRAIARRFEVSDSSIWRHRQKHVPEALLKAQDAEEVAHGQDLVTQMQELQERTLKILETAERDGRLPTALQAIREARGNIELTSKLTGQMVERHEHMHRPVPPEVVLEIRDHFHKGKR